MKFFFVFLHPPEEKWIINISMENKNENKFEIIASHFHGEERDDVVKNLPDDEDFKAVKRIYSQRDKVSLLARLSRIEDAKKKVDRRLRRQLSFSGRNYKFFRYAAVFLVLIALTGVFGKMIYRSLVFEDKVAITTIVSSTGEMKEVALPDGTKIWLGANSTLKYNNSFGEKNRNVVFNGEAMFDVAKDEILPFFVKLEDASVKVYGTRFLLISYTAGNKNEVVLLEGKVGYQRKNEVTYMSPGEYLTDNRLTGEMVVNMIDPDHYKDWINGKVYLDNKDLDDLAFLLEQWYGVKFGFINDSLKTYQFTGMINKEKPLEYTLKIIALTNKVKFKKGENEIMITN